MLSLSHDRHKMAEDDFKRVQDSFKSVQDSRRWFQDVFRQAEEVPSVSENTMYFDFAPRLCEYVFVVFDTIKLNKSQVFHIFCGTLGTRTKPQYSPKWVSRSFLKALIQLKEVRIVSQNTIRSACLIKIASRCCLIACRNYLEARCVSTLVFTTICATSHKFQEASNIAFEVG